MSQAHRLRSKRRRAALRRRVLAVVLVAAAVAAGGAAWASRNRPHSKPAATPRTARRVVRASAPAPPTPPRPIPGYLMIADRGNNRLLLVDGNKRIIWRYPAAGSSPAAPFRFDDDAFFAPGYHRIISNQEEQHTIEVLSFPAGALLWRYGHVNVRSGAQGYLNTPDDAYLLPNGLRSVADAYNCRVLFISAGHRVVRQIGATGVCRHDPPRTIGAPNGATPLPNGDTLISEIAGSWIDDVSRSGHLRWSFQAPVAYPSDPQPLPEGHILLADYTRPGRVVILDRHGRVLWSYGPSSGDGALDHPSLAMPLGHGLIAVNDDYRDRVVIISIRTRRIVWQYGHTDQQGTASGYLNTPDGMDLLPTLVAEHSTAVQALVRATPASAASRASQAQTQPGQPIVSRLHDLPAAVQRAVAVGYRGRLLIVGGLDAGQASTSGVFSLSPSTGKLQSLGTVPQAFHDAAAAAIGRRLVVFGGGDASSSSSVQAFDLSSRRGSVFAHLPRPLSDLVATTVGSTVYLVGGYDGSRAQAAVYSTSDGRHFRHVATLPVGLRYPAVATVGGRIVVAGGQTQTGLSAAVYVVDPTDGTVRRIGSLPKPIGQAAAVVEGTTVFVLGGRDTSGAAVRDVTAVDTVGTSIRAGRPLPAALADAAVARIGGTWYLVGGWRGANIAQVLALRSP